MLPAGGTEVVGVLPCPANKLNQGAADFLESQLFAYGVGSSVAVVEVHELQPACMLQGGHRTHAVTAVKWSPDCHSRDLKSHSSHLRLASGDAAGGVVVWSLLSGSVISRLEDHFAVRDYVRSVSKSREGGGGPGSGPSGGGGGGGGTAGGSGADAGQAVGAVMGLAWFMSSSAVLAVLLSPGTLLLWDTKGGAVLWKRSLPGPDVWQGLEVDPLDCRCLAVSSGQGGLALVSLEDPGSGRVDVKTYRVGGGGFGTGSVSASHSVAPAASFRPSFCAARGLLFLLLPRELIVYDTELGTPAATRTLPSGCAPFSSLLGVYGSGVSAGSGDEGGCDYVYVTHVDGGLSVFVRVPGELRFQLAHTGLLMPPPIRGSRHSVSLLAVCAGLWRGGGGGAAADVGGAEARATAHRNQVSTQHLRTVFAAASRAAGAATDGRLAGFSGSPAKGAHPPSHGTHQHHQHHRQPHHGHGHGDPHGTQAHHPTAGHGHSHGHGHALGGYPGGGAVPGAAQQQPQQLRQPRSGSSSERTRPVLIVVALTADGRVWRFDTALPTSPLPGLHFPSPSLGGAATVTHGPHSAGALAAATPPQLAGLLHTLPSAVTTFAVYPRPVAANSLRLTAAAGAGSYDRGGGGAGAGGVVLLGAAATLGGTLELFTVHRGLVSPLSVQVSASFASYRDAPVRGLRWLGATPRLVTFFSDRGAHGWSNHLFITDVRSGRSEPLPRDAVGAVVSSGGAPSGGAGGAGGGGGGAVGGGGEAAPLLGVRASPCGNYLLVLVKGSSAELWGVWPGAQPTRLRLIDLPFSCVEWVQPPLPFHELPAFPSAAPSETDSGAAGFGGGLEGGAWRLPARSDASAARGGATAAGETGEGGPHRSSGMAAAPEGTSAAVAFSLSCSRDTHTTAAAAAAALAGSPSMGPGGAPAAAAAPTAGLEEAQLVFTLTDGRAGVLLVRGKQVSDMRVKRPMAGLLAPLELTATAIAAVGRMAVMGDSEGRLAVWDWNTGRTTLHATGLGLVRKMQFSPPSPPFPPASPAGSRPSYGNGPGSAGSGLPSLSSPPPPAPFSPPGPSSDPLGGVPSSSAAGPTSSPMAASAFTTSAAASTAASAAAAGSGGGGTAAATLAPQPSTMGGAAAGAAGGSGGSRARVAVLYASGQCCVFDLDTAHRLRPLLATSAAGIRPVLDIGLLPTWWLTAAGGGGRDGGAGAGGNMGPTSTTTPCLLAITTDEGSLSVLDVGVGATGSAAGNTAGLPSASYGQHLAAAAAVAADSVRLSPRMGRRQQMIVRYGGFGGGTPGTRLQLAQARALASSLLLPRPWAMLLRLLLQLGVSQELLRYLCGAYCPGEAEEEDVRLELLARFPRAARGPLLALLADIPQSPTAAGNDGAGAADPAAGTALPPAAAAAAPTVAAALPPPGPGAAPGAPASAGVGASGGGILGLPSGLGTAALALSGTMLRAMSNSLTSLATPPAASGAVAATATSAASGPPPPGAAPSLEPPKQHAIPQQHPQVPLLPLSQRQQQQQQQHSSSLISVDSAGGGAGGGSGLLHLLRSLASMRAQGRLLHPDEWLHYTMALQPGASPAGRMAVAAQVAGATEEARFWTHLPATLAALRARELAASGAPATAAPQGPLPGAAWPGAPGDAAGRSGAGGAPAAPTAAPAAAQTTPPGASRPPSGLLQTFGSLSITSAPPASDRPPSSSALSPFLGASSAASTGAAAGLPSPRPPSHPSAAAPTTAAGTGQSSAVSIPGASAGSGHGAGLLQGGAGASGAVGTGLSSGTGFGSAPTHGTAPVAATQGSVPGGGGSSAVSSLMMLIKSPSSGMLAQAAAAVTGSAMGAAAPPPPLPRQQLPTAAAPESGTGAGAAGTGPSSSGAAAPAAAAPAGQGSEAPGADDGVGSDEVLLWDERLVLAEAQERVKWREAQSGAMFDLSPEQQERRLLEYMALGDLQTAVAYLLASSPENSARYYRDALCTLALAAAASTSGVKQPGAAARGSAGSMLLAQSAKVVSAHAASIGDVLLGVPLHLAAGLHAEAAALLQESGLWRQAAVMAAHSLPAGSADRVQTLQRWAQHVWRLEGSAWRAAGILTAAGCLAEALQLLLDAGLPDCAAAFAACCEHAGLAAPTGAAAPAAAAPPLQPLPQAAAAASGAGRAARPLYGGGDLINLGSGDGDDEWGTPRGTGTGPSGLLSASASASEAAGAAASATAAAAAAEGRRRSVEALSSSVAAAADGDAEGEGYDLYDGTGPRAGSAVHGIDGRAAAGVSLRGSAGVRLLRAAEAEFERFVTDLLTRLMI